MRGMKRGRGRGGIFNQTRRDTILMYRPVRTGRDLVPREVIVEFPYTHEYNVVTATTGDVLRWFSNTIVNIEQQNVVVATSAIPSLSFYSTGYKLFRVVAYKVEFQIVNTGAAPVNVFMTASVANPGFTVTPYVASSGNKWGQHRLLSAQAGGAGSRTVMRQALTHKALVGSPTIDTDDDYAGSLATASDPVQTNYIALAFQAATGTVTCYVQMKLTLTTRVYDPALFVF